MEVLDAEVLATLQDDILQPRIVEQALALALEELAPARQAEHRDRVRADLVEVEAECERLADAIARGGPLDALVERLRSSEAKRVALQARIRTADQPIKRSPANLTSELRRRLADWRGLLTKDVEQGREILRQVLVKPLRFTPVIDGRRRGYEFTGTVALDRVVSGIVDLPATLTGVASPAGCACILRREYTVETAA